CSWRYPDANSADLDQKPAKGFVCALKAIEGVSRAMNIMRAIDKMSKAIKEHEKVVQEGERLREEYRRPGRKSSSELGLA
ncbi:MAG: hypothetical protein DRO05_08185, partial [Thermoproteota archaeon]